MTGVVHQYPALLPRFALGLGISAPGSRFSQSNRGQHLFFRRTRLARGFHGAGGIRVDLMKGFGDFLLSLRFAGIVISFQMIAYLQLHG